MEVLSMLNLTDKEMLASLGLKQCWFYGCRVDDHRKISSLIAIFLQDIITGMPVGEVCCFYIKNRNYVKLLCAVPGEWELYALDEESSKPFLALEWLTGL